MKIGRQLLLLFAFFIIGHTAFGHVPAGEVSSPATSGMTAGGHEIVFIEDNVADWEQLATQATEARSNVEVVRLDSRTDGLAQISAVLEQHRNLAGIHIISHGTPGKLALGSTELSSANLDQNAAQLQRWGTALATDAGILLYGCELAQGASGLHFIGQLSALAQAGVVASTDVTGAQQLGGDWDFEARTRLVSSAPLAFPAYASLLSPYTVTYDKNNPGASGTVPVDGTAYLTGDTVTVRSNTGLLSHPTQTLIGWNTEANGSGTGFAPTGAASFTMGSANVTLYAVWANHYTFTYNGNGNTSGTAPVDGSSPYLAGATVTVRPNSGALARIGYNFAGWNTQANGLGTNYAATGTAIYAPMPAANVVLYARWTTGSFGVTYVGNGNTGGVIPVDGAAYATGDTVTVQANIGTLVKSGFTFAGWNTAADGSGIDYPADGTTTFQMGSANVSLYAKWINSYSVLYHGNGNTGGVPPIDSFSPYDPGETVTVYPNSGNLTRTGYEFAGWNTAADGSGTTYPATGSATFTMNSDIVHLYALWLNAFSVTYDGNGATGGTPPTDANSPYDPGETVTVLTNSGNLVRVGFVFVGWNTAPDGTGTNYAASGTATFPVTTGNVTLYARWTNSPFNTGGLQAENELDGSGFLRTVAPSDLVTNLNQLDNSRVGLSENGVLVVLNNGLSNPIQFRNNPPDNVLISVAPRKPVDMQIGGNTLNVRIDPETLTPARQTLLATSTLLLSSGVEVKGLQLVQGEAIILNAQANGAIAGLELSKNATARTVVVQGGPQGGSAGIRKTADGAGAISAESGEIRVVSRLKNSSTTAPVSVTLRAGEVARFDMQGQLSGIFLGSVSGTAGKTGDRMVVSIPQGIGVYPSETLLFEGGNTLGRSNKRLSDQLNGQFGGALQFSQRADGLVQVISAGSYYYGRAVALEVVPDAPDGTAINADGSLSLTFGTIRSTLLPALQDSSGFAADMKALGNYSTDVLDTGLVQVSGGPAVGWFYVARPRFEQLPATAGTVRGIAFGEGGTTLTYTGESGRRQLLDPAFRNEALVRQTANALGWTVKRSGQGGKDLIATSPAGQSYRVMADFKVEILETINTPANSGLRTVGGKIYFYYPNEGLRQGLTLQPL